jgi:hypothetical protein
MKTCGVTSRSFFHFVLLSGIALRLVDGDYDSLFNEDIE